MNSFFKKSFSLLLTLCLMLLAFGLTVRVNAEELSDTFDLSTKGVAETCDKDNLVYRSTYFTLTINKGTSKTPANNYTPDTSGQSYTSTRFYKNQTFTLQLTNNNYQINNITCIATTEGYATAFAGSTWSNATAKYSSTTVTITPDDKTANITATIGGTCGFKSITVFYQDKNVINVGVSGNDTAMVNNSIVFTATLNGEEHDASWSVDNSDYATIDAKGVLTPTENGVFKTVNVTATINETSSAPFAVTIYPNNENPISIAQALEICEFVGNTNSPFKYSTIGTVTNVQANQFELLNEEKSIVVFMYSHNQTEGERIVVTGNLKKFNGATPEFINPTFTSLYNVTFDSNGGTTVDGISDVSDGAKIIAPVEPTKDGYVFQGWYNGITLWDFENDTVTSDLILVAKWANETLNAFLNTFNTKAYMSMGYKYSIEKGDAAYSIVKDYSSLKAGDKIVIAAKDSAFALSNTQNDKNRGQAPIVKNGSSIDLNQMSDVCVFTLEEGNIKGTWAFYDSYNKGYLYAASSSSNYLKTQSNCDNNASWAITIENGVTKIQAQGTNTRNLLRYNSSSKLFSCYSSGQQDVVLYKLSNTVNYSNVDFRIRCGIDKDLATKVQTLGQEAVYGISVSTSEKEVKYASTSEFYQVEEKVNGKAYVIIDLGDVLNNSERIDVVFTVRAYVEIDGETYYSSEEKCYSLVDLVQTYLNNENTKDLMVNLRTIFEGFGKNFN